jgi:hypothetical protein
VLDSRYGRRHFYPPVGYSVAALPSGYRSVRHGNNRYYFSAGIWYWPGPSGYMVVRPPLGIVVPILPPFYTSLWVGSSLYYYANDVYYVAAPGGYLVTAPPTEPVIVEATPAPDQPSSDTGPYPEGTWYYCESAGAYHPYVTECAEGWLPVPAVPADLVSQLSTLPSYPEGTWYYCESAGSYYPYVSECPTGWRPVPASSQTQPATR